jgi:hypothetical protein
MPAAVSGTLAVLLATATLAALGQDAGIERRRPGGAAVEPRPPKADPLQASSPPPPIEALPVPDRWRILRSLGVLPYERWDPYHPNALKGDLPLESGPLEGWFVNLTALSDTVLEASRLPVGRRSEVSETAILGLALIKGDTAFRPPDYQLRFAPVVSLDRTSASDTRKDHFVGVQELFFDKHLRDISVRYDFDSLRIGVQPFAADFRGLLFTDQPFGVRLYGTRDNNQWQYNAAWFRRIEKDTNSGLNDLGQRLRADDAFVFNLYRQDWPVPGFTTQGIVLHNRNREGDRGQYVNANGVVERPALFGTGQPHSYDVTYPGLNGEGHFGRWNLSLSGYLALGLDQRGMVSGREERIGAWFGAVELSRDFDWLRLRVTGVYASGDRNPFDGSAQGFDAMLENPTLAGADTSYWIRQSMPLNGSGVALSVRNGMLASLRSSREHGQSNFTNPGVRLFGIGGDADVAPQLRLIGNVNYLSFDNLSSLAALRNQRLTSGEIGLDLSVGAQYRPLFIQNIVLNASLAVLLPGKGLRELYGDALDATQYSALANLVLTF